ncbi:MAG: HEAT repeat domain-containing protein [Planctomycetota bacterium]
MRTLRTNGGAVLVVCAFCFGSLAAEPAKDPVAGPPAEPEISEEAALKVLAAPRKAGDLSARVKAIDALAKKGSPKALETLLKLAKGRDYEMRAAAMEGLARFHDDPQAQATLLGALKDKDPALRAVALRAIGRLREKWVVDALIDVVGREKEEESLRVGALKRLVALTNQNMGLVGEDWKKWWQLARQNFQFPTGEERSFTSVRVRDLSYFGIEVASKRIGFLVDVSSSMTEMVPVRSEAEKEAEDRSGKTSAGEKPGKVAKSGKQARKIDVLKKELVRVLKVLPADAAINIVTFHATYNSWQKQLVPLAGRGRAMAVAYVEGLQTGVGTNVYDTLEHALRDRFVDTIYLLTDGLPTRGRYTDAGDILREIGALNRVRGVTIHAIAFGEPSKLLEDLAAQNGGEYRFVDRY